MSDTGKQRTPMVVGNWKMNGRREMADALGAGVAAAVPADIEVLLCPPFPYLETVSRAVVGSAVGLGAQNLCEQADGAFTGEVSAEMLVDLGCSRVLVGHSERRTLFWEDNERVAEKFVRAREAGLAPILCIGETLQEREAGRTREVLARQLAPLLQGHGASVLEGAVIAYEPVWAIGTGHSATAEQAQQTHGWVREHLAGADREIASRIRLLYGGSVKADNAASLFRQADIDGGLIGGASLEADSFLAICKAATAQ